LATPSARFFASLNVRSKSSAISLSA